MRNIETSDNSAKFGIMYNYYIVKRHDDRSGMVELAKLGGKKPKYATIEYVDSKFDDLKIELKGGMVELRTELKSDISELKNDNLLIHKKLDLLLKKLS